MSPRHFARLNQSSKQIHAEHDGLAQAFSSFTSLIGLGRYFSTDPVPEMNNSITKDPKIPGDQKTNHSSLYK
jgi:hypothetical protein